MPNGEGFIGLVLAVVALVAAFVVPFALQSAVPTVNIAFTFFGSGLSTASTSFVSTGEGVTMKVKNHSNITVVASAEAFDTGGVGRLDFKIYTGTTSIPGNGSPPNVGDIVVAEGYTDPPTTTAIYDIALAGSKSTGYTGTFYAYLAFASGGIGISMNTASGGGMIVQED